MRLPSINPTTTQAWKKLQLHFSSLTEVKMQDLFVEDPKRAERMSISWEDFYVDYSKNRITDETLSLLMDLAREVDLDGAIELQFSGNKINETEGRAVGHTQLRNFDSMRPEVKAALAKMESFSEAIINKNHLGFTGKPITDIVNIGIGGSDLGPKMVIEALQFYKNHLNVHFVSNVDGDHVQEVIQDLNPETTLFIIVSKTFSTQETLANATTIRNWFLKNASEKDIAKHFAAVSTNLEAVADFGISEENVFPMWEWVGGRFSLWSAVGLSIACGIGYKNFEALLEGAHKMDRHFETTPFSENLPVVLALLSVWYNNFFQAESEAVLPYSQYLDKLVSYLQQGVMESNGKSVDRNGDKIAYQTGTIVWGSTGTNAQHAFFQLIHQGTKVIPSDFIAYKTSLYGETDHQNKLMANCLAQTEALLQGTTGENIESPFRVFEGNKPSNTLLIDALTPKSLGELIALYEHKIFVQGIVWNIYSYDQWGVELGKKLAKGTLDAIENNDTSRVTNSSTKELLKKL